MRKIVFLVLIIFMIVGISSSGDTSSQDTIQTMLSQDLLDQANTQDNKSPVTLNIIENPTKATLDITKATEYPAKQIESSLPKPTMLPIPPTVQPPKLPVENIKGLGDAQQVVLVTTPSPTASIATVQTFEKVNGKWQIVFAPINAVVGKNGISSNKVEGDQKSPEGIFAFGTFFGKNENPGVTFPYRRTTSNDFWVDDSDSSLYNSWQTGPVDGRWASAENLLRDDWLYDYAAVIDYNPNRSPGKGSAIFLHIWRAQGQGTVGCTAMSQTDLLKLMKWLNPSKNPRIIQAPLSDLGNL